MDKLINQSIEDQKINEIIRKVHHLKFSISLTEGNWERRYQESLSYQKSEYDRYVERNGKPPMVFEDNPYYFLQRNDHIQTFDISSFLVIVSPNSLLLKK